MKSKLLIYIVPVAALTAFLLWWFSDKQIIQRRTNSALDCLELPVGTGRAERVMKADKAKDLLADSVQITYPAGTSVFTGAPVEFKEAITLPKNQAISSHTFMTEIMEFMHVKDRAIKDITIKDDTATVSLSFKLDAKSKKGQQQSKQLDGTLTFKKIKGNWLLAEASFPN